MDGRSQPILTGRFGYRGSFRDVWFSFLGLHVVETTSKFLRVLVDQPGC